MSFGLCNAPASFQRWMMSIFFDMIEEIMEVFIDDFSVYGKNFNDCLENLDSFAKMWGKALGLKLGKMLFHG